MRANAPDRSSRFDRRDRVILFTFAKEEWFAVWQTGAGESRFSGVCIQKHSCHRAGQG
jgi:hypothetical protein